MKNSKNGLDEMQLERRNRIGNQMFMLMFYALLFNGSLYGAGIRWLDYPANVMVIITACMGIYLVRLIALNAYLPPKAQNRKTIFALIFSITCSVAFTLSALRLFDQETSAAVETANDNSALILFIVSAVGLVSTLITAVIKKVNSKSETDD